MSNPKMNSRVKQIVRESKIENKIRKILESANEEKKLIFFDLLEKIDQITPDGITRPKGISLSQKTYVLTTNNKQQYGGKIQVPITCGHEIGTPFYWEKHSSGILLLIPDVK